MSFSDLPDPLFRIRPETDLFFQIKIRPKPNLFLIKIQPEPDLFNTLRSGRIQMQEKNSRIRNQILDPVVHQSLSYFTRNVSKNLKSIRLHKYF